MSHATRYGFWHRNIHWLTAALVIAALALVELHDLAQRGSALRSNMMYGHMQFGMAVLLLFLPRLVLRLTGMEPPVEPAVPWWMHLPARAAHGIFYLLMVAQPVLGILMVQASGRSLAFLGLPIPSFVSPDKALAKTLDNLHVIGGNVFLWLAIVHAAVALWHHWGRKDNTLRRMLYSRD